MPVGNYVMRVRVGVVEGTPASRRFIQVGHPQREIESRDWGLEGRALSSHQVSGTIDKPEVIEIPLKVGANTPKEFAVQEKQTNNGSLKVQWDDHNKLKAENGYGHPQRSGLIGWKWKDRSTLIEQNVEATSMKVELHAMQKWVARIRLFQRWVRQGQSVSGYWQAAEGYR